MSKTLASDRDSGDIHANALIVIGYMNPVCRFLPGGGVDYAPFFRQDPWSQGCVPRLHRGGVDVAVVSFGLNDPDLFPGAESVTRVFQHLGAFLDAVRAHSGEVEIAHTSVDIRRIRRAGKIALILHLTGVHLAGSVEILEAYRAMGVRSIHPPFDSIASQRVDAWSTGSPLTPFGRKVVQKMQALGMIVDLAHASDRMFRDVLRITAGPIIVSHGTCRTISSTKRNMTDDQIRAVAATGGVVGVHFAGQLLDAEYSRRRDETDFIKELRGWEEALKRKHPDRFDYLVHRYDYRAWVRSEAYEIQQGIPPPSLDKLLDHVDHMVELVGIDHVGVGADYELGNIPKAINRADKLGNLTRALRARGHSKRAVQKIWGGNFMRVFVQHLKDNG